jgi:hypothetical protein
VFRFQSFWAFWAWIVAYPIAIAIVADVSKRRARKA